ncbi:TPR-like protein [Serendipita vermifera]|nr:TPR-like protein [Serendipita vermifera]
MSYERKKAVSSPTYNPYFANGNETPPFRESSRTGSMRRLRRISGIFEQTAIDVKDNANHIMSTIIVPASDSSKQYAAEQPVKATFLALLTFFSFIPILLFLVFVVATIVLFTFTSVSFAITSTVLAFTLAAAFLAATLLVCVAPASLLATLVAFVVLGTLRFAQYVILGHDQYGARLGERFKHWVEEAKDCGGGLQSFSQLELLKGLMDRVQFDMYPEDMDKVVLPCDYFDLIGGSDTGGLISIMLSVLHMSVEETMEDFAAICERVYAPTGLEPAQRTTLLRNCLESIFIKKKLDLGMRMAQSQGSHRSKGFAIATIKENVQTKIKFRTYRNRTGAPLDITVLDAMMATCASPNFEPVTIGTSFRRKTYLSGPFSCRNPIRELIAEAHDLSPSPEEEYIATLVSLGAGHPGIITGSAPHASGESILVMVPEILANCDQVADEMANQIGHLGIYYRLSLPRGLEVSTLPDELDLGYIYTQTVSYCETSEGKELLDNCVKSLQASIGIATVEQLKHSGGGVVAHKSLPAITPNFVMREEPWRRLEQVIEKEKSVSITQHVVVVSGMAGCGKTQLCTKFLHQYSLRFEKVFAIDGSSESSIQADLVAHIRSLGPRYSQASLTEVTLFLCDPRNTRWLLFIDNVDDINLDLRRYLPDCNHGVIIITTRNRLLGHMASKPGLHLELDVMSAKEAALMLQSAAPSLQLPQDVEGLHEIAKQLGYLPVALAQGGAYIRENHCSANDYLELLKESRVQLLRYEGYDRQKASAYTAFEVSFRRLPPEIQDFLYIISHYHFADFPMASFGHAARHGFNLEPYALVPRDSIFDNSISLLKSVFFIGDGWNILAQHSIIRTLQSYSMASFTSGFKTELLRLHPLFSDWIHDRIPSERRLLLLSSAARVLACGQGERWMEPYFLPHIKRMVSNPFWERIHVNDKAAMGRILREMDHLSDAREVWSSIYRSLESTEGPQGVGLASTAIELAWTHSTDLTEMEALERQALSIFESSLGPDDEKTQLASDSLAGTYVEMGRFQEAEKMMLRSLQRLRNVYEDENPRIVNTMHALALSYYAARDYPEAEKYQAIVLPVKRKRLGDNHPDTLLAMYNLASIYQCQGKYSEAEELQVQVLAARKAILGENHIDTLSSMHELASTYDFQGRYLEAEEMEKEVVKRRVEILGKDHPETLLSMHNLSFNYQSQGRFEEAEEMQRTVLSGWRESLGEDHPDTLLAMYGLASCYRSQGRYFEAEELQRKVLTKRRETLGEEHPDTLLTMASLASTYYCQGAYTKAEELQLQVLTRKGTILGEFHSDTLSAMCDLALTYDAEGRYTETEALETKVLEARTQALGPDHPDTLLAMHNLASTYHSLERYEDAEQLESKVVEVRNRLLGGSHPDTLLAMHNLASTYRSQQRYAEAEELQLKVIAQRTEMLGATHNDTLTTMESLALTYTKSGRIAEATEIQTRLSILQKRRGDSVST